MVRVKLTVRIIPEDVYLRDIESSTPQPTNIFLEREKRLLQVVHEPEKMSIGVLANQIKGVFQRINHDPLGDIKYLKDGNVDADLDPEMSVYDAFVDAGKAATDVADQTATIKIIREIMGRQFGVREGSVVPDLSDPRFQPRRPPPPVPHFSDTGRSLGKRSREDAFREEVSNRQQSRSPTSRRRRRLDGVDEGEAGERLAPSIERDLHHPSHEASRHHQGSPVVIPETQDSPLRHGTIPRKGGSEILGEDEPKSESPEVDNSIHSLPLVQKDANDLEILETASTTQNSAPTESRNLRDIQARRGPALTHEPRSRSSSNYYSPKSGSLQSTSNGNAPVHDSAPSSAESAVKSNQVDPTTSFARTKINLAKGAIDDGPITPPSDASRSRQSKAIDQDPSHALSNQGGPQSRASSFSYKFRREDRANRAGSEIVDTQMSPRSRKPMKRPRQSRDPDTAHKMVGLREISGLFHHVDEKRPLIQERKRERKETTWDFSEHIDGLSVADEDAMVDKIQEEDDHCGYIVEQRSKSHALSDGTNKDSNASTERQIMTTSLNGLDLPQAASHESPKHAPDEDDSDKENTNREQASYAQSSVVRVHQDSNEEARDRTTPIDEGHTHRENEMDVDKDTESVVEILNNNATTEREARPKMIAKDVQQLPAKGSELVNSSVGPPEQTPFKMSRSRRKKSRIENEEMTKPIIQQSVAQSAATAMASNTCDKAGSQNSTSPSKPKSGKKVSPAIEPDEQLSQDLQASAQAGNTGMRATAKNGKGSARKIVASEKNGITNSKSAGNNSSKSSRTATDLHPKSAGTNKMQDKSKDIVTNPIASDSDVEIVAMKTNFPEKTTGQEKSKDGKLGLGFSQSPPSKKKGFLLPNVKFDNLEGKGRSDNSGFLSRGKPDMSFLKKSKSFDKLMSSQSWNDETPSRSTQPEKDLGFKSRISVDVSPRKPDTMTPQNNAEPTNPVQRLTKENGRQPTFSSDEDSSTSGDEKADQIQLKSVKTGSSADAPMATIEITSDSSSAESRAGLSSPRMASKVNKAHDGGPKIVPKGGNMYDVNGTSIVVPLGLTLDAYLAMRADLATQPPRLNGRARVASSGKSATPTLNQRGNSATPVPVPTKVAPKKSLTKLNSQQPNVDTNPDELHKSGKPTTVTKADTKANDLPGSSKVATAPKSSVKQGSNSAKPEDVPQSSSAVTTKKAKGTNAAAKANAQAPSKSSDLAKKANETKGSVKANAEAPAKLSAPAKEGNATKAAPTAKAQAPTAKAQAPTAPSAPAKKGPVTTTAAKSVPNPPTKPNALRPISAKKPTNLSELKAQREAERAKEIAAQKTSGMPTPNLANGKNFLRRGSDSESESETESDSSSSDGEVVTSKGNGNARPTPGKTPATGAAKVDLSIRDPSPSSDEEDESD